MRVNTRYNAGQQAWYADNGNIRQKAIHKIIAAEKHYSKGKTEVVFYMDDHEYATPYQEKQLFDTKVEAAQAWVLSQGISTDDLRCKPDLTVGLDIDAELQYAVNNWNAKNKNEVINSLNLVLKELERS